MYFLKLRFLSCVTYFMLSLTLLTGSIKFIWFDTITRMYCKGLIFFAGILMVKGKNIQPKFDPKSVISLIEKNSEKSEPLTFTVMQNLNEHHWQKRLSVLWLGPNHMCAFVYCRCEHHDEHFTFRNVWANAGVWTSPSRKDIVTLTLKFMGAAWLRQNNVTRV